MGTVTTSVLKVVSQRQLGLLPTCTSVHELSGSFSMSLNHASPVLWMVAVATAEETLLEMPVLTRLRSTMPAFCAVALSATLGPVTVHVPGPEPSQRSPP